MPYLRGVHDAVLTGNQRAKSSTSDMEHIGWVTGSPFSGRATPLSKSYTGSAEPSRLTDQTLGGDGHETEPVRLRRYCASV